MFGIGVLSVLSSITVATIGEGYSSSSPGAHISAGQRAFTIYTHREACEKADYPAAIVVAPIELTVGDSFRLTDPVVEAFDAEGNFIPNVPLEILDPDTTDRKLRKEMHSLRQDYVAVEAGQKTIHFRASCSEPPGVVGELVITIKESAK